jgi:predicted lysophospholipase L1 biosynthesis ABC-type transport system permease subunit
MISRFVFYLQYAARNLMRSARWTTFAIFCIAAGVATVVALRGLGLSIGDSLIDNVRITNHGDITIMRESGFGMFGGGDPENQQRSVIQPSEIQQVEAYVAEKGGMMTVYGVSESLQITAVDTVTVGRPQFISSLLIDPETFPPYGEILALEPEGVPLRNLFAQPNSVVISRNLADLQNLSVGDTVRVSNTTEMFTVTGIVGTENESGFRNILASFFGFAYIDIANAELLQVSMPNAISITLPEGIDIESAAGDIRNMGIDGRYTTVPMLVRQNQTISDVLGRFIVIMGLGALLIGGVGIINTMLVMVGRRTIEIAALKTFGLKGRQVSAMFMAEAFLLGLVGSIVGCVIGVLLTGIVNQYGEAFLQQRLTWRLYPEAIAYGMGLGMVVTLVFGILPVLTATKVRPATILRPNETVMPAAGCLQSLIALVLVIVVIGAAAGQILGNVLIGVIGVAATLLILGLLVGVLWVVVWLVGKLPSFGIVDVRLALRNMTSRRIRTATTLLALSAGMFALSAITFVGAGTREILQFQLANELGGNVLVFPTLSVISPQLAQTLLGSQLTNIEGVEYNTRLSNYSGRIIAVDGEAPPEVELPLGDNAPERMQRNVDRAFSSITLLSRESDRPDLSSGTISVGRDLTPEDRGQRVMVVSEGMVIGNLNLRVGSVLTLRIGREEVDYEVVGMAASSGAGFSFGQAYVPPESAPGQPQFQFNVLQVPQDDLNRVLLRLSEIPLIFTLDISFIDGLLSRLINQFAALPTLVGLLSLLAAAVTMANTVSLATLERRRQIGVLRAIGLKGKRVLGVMLIENMLIGLLGGVLGIGFSALGVAILTALGSGDAVPIPREATPVAIALVIASIVIAGVATLLSARAAVGEPVTSVLRYE